MNATDVNPDVERELMAGLRQVWESKAAELGERERALSEDLASTRAELSRLMEGLKTLDERLGIALGGQVDSIDKAVMPPIPHDGDTPSEGVEPAEPPKRRFKSPEVTARIVFESGRPMTRAEIKAEMEARDLIPDTWVNPTNAISTATLRAKERGWIVEVEPNVFAAPGGDRPGSGMS